MSWEYLLSAPRAGQHLVQLYRDEGFFTTAVARYVCEGLLRGEAVIAVLSRAHRDAVLARLREAGCDPKAALGGRLKLFDAQESLDAIVRDGMLQRGAFRELFAPLIAEAGRACGRVRVVGEVVDLLWREGRREAAAELESLWNELAREQPFALLCVYRVDTLQRSIYGGALECLCKGHSHVIPARDYAGFNSAVAEAALHVLGAPLAGMLSTLSRRHKPPAEMPAGQAMLFWLGGNMPYTAEKVMRRARERLALEEAKTRGSFAGSAQVSASQ